MEERASDAEREQAIAVLRDASVEGRLTLDELAARTELAHAARTRGELVAVTSDLPAPVPAAEPEPERQLVLCSALRREGRFRLPPRSRFLVLCGTLQLDLRQALLDGPEARVELRNFFGTATVLVPEHVDVEVTGGGAFATRDVRLGSEPPPPGAPVVRIHVSGPGGTLRVRSEPPLRDELSAAVRSLAQRLAGPPR